MGPDPRQRRAGKKQRQPRSADPLLRIAPNSNDEHTIVFFRRHVVDDSDQTAPGRIFLNACPPTVRAKLRAVLVAVATAPPKKFSGGGYWEAMHDEMSGWFEIRVDGPNRHHYRLFCLLDYEAIGHAKPLLVVIDGRDKPFRTALPDVDYAQIHALGIEYRMRNPRSIL